MAASETAFVAFLRYVGLDVPPPRVSPRAPDDVVRWLRRRVPVTYERKRKASDAGRFVARKRLLAVPDAGYFACFSVLMLVYAEPSVVWF